MVLSRTSTGRVILVPTQLRFDPPEQAKMWKKSMTVRELWVSVTDPDALVTACTAK